MRKSDLTRQRILAAATTEFAAKGIAGARMDRIAETAPANKSQIYAYFGDKEALFDHVLQAALERGSQSITVEHTDLAAYAGALYDYFGTHPELFRLGLWRQLERPSSSAPGEAESWAAKREQIAEEQDAGRITAGVDARDILAVVVAVTQAWHLAPTGLLGDASTPELSVTDSRRALVATTVAAFLSTH